MNKHVIWVTWEEQRRNVGIADALSAKLFEFNLAVFPRWKKYIIGSWLTFKLYMLERPDVVIVQNPSVVLALLTIIWRPVFKYAVGVDSHNAAFALDGNGRILEGLAHYIQRNADFIIAHNDQLKDKVRHIGGQVFALPDRIPYIKTPKFVPEDMRETQNNVFFVCSFAKDEPYEEVLCAAMGLPDVTFFISGNHRKVGLTKDDVPDNVTLLGRVDWDTFDAYLWFSDAIMDLTTRENCLLCGNYEAVSVGKPLITSDTEALKSYFSQGTVYVENKGLSIANIIKDVFGLDDKVALRHSLAKEMKEFRHTIEVDWFNRLGEIQKVINRGKSNA